MPNDQFIVTAWSCVDGASSTDCVATATSTVDVPSYYDWMTVMGFELLLISFLVYGVFFSEFGRKYRKSI